MLLNLAVWGLDLEQEFVYVGDEAVVEPSGKTRRYGLDLSIRYQLTDWLFLDADLNLTEPCAKDEPEGENYTPLAPTLTSTGGLTTRFRKGLNARLRYRYIGDRPANEDDSVAAVRWEFRIQMQDKAGLAIAEQETEEAEEGFGGEAEEEASPATVEETPQGVQEETDTQGESEPIYYIPLTYFAERTFQCQPGRGHLDFTTELCV